jgi:hypothetical protein
MLQFLNSVPFIDDIALCYVIKNIRYSSVKHNQILFKYGYIFQPKKSNIRPRLQKLLN